MVGQNNKYHKLWTKYLDTNTTMICNDYCYEITQ